MLKRKRIKAKRNPYKRVSKLLSRLTLLLIKWFARNLLPINKRYRHSKSSGFVLPTAMMVLLVVILLTTAMMLRSFDRARNASNVRASQAAIKAATPAISRAEVKIEELLKAPTLQRETPSELALYNAIKNNPKYTFGDETRLRLAFDLNNDNLIQTSNTNLENDETLTTAWRFPVDTDNNGKFDSYTLYGIYFRSPNRSSSGDARGNLNRSISPLETRLAPITTQIGGRRCENLLGNSTSLLGDSGWYKSGDELKKSFFVYTASVPITDNTGLGTAFEKFSGNSSFYALEYQQDQSRILQNNYAVLFDGDLQLAPNSDFRLNGRVHTNGNLLVGGHNNAKVRFYQVSDKSSCFYREENAKITVGGNVANGSVTDRLDGNTVDIDLFDNNPEQDNAQIGSNNKSIETSGGEKVAYNHDAYNQRIALMKREALSYCREENKYCSELNPPRISTVLDIDRYPQEVKNTFSDRVKQNPSLNAFNILSEELELYFKQRTRRVPYAEIENPDDVTDFYTEANIFPGDGIIEPPVKWREPTVTNTKLQLKTQQLEATFPEQQQGIEKYLGDRIVAGNNLPAYWKNGKGYTPTFRQYIDGANWTEPDNLPRYRTSQIQPFDNLNMAERDNFWEEKAANGNSLADSGGLRIITGTGIYQHKGNPSSKIPKLRDDSFLAKYLSTDLSRRTTLDSGEDIPEFPQDLRLADEEIINQKYALVWHDTMPMKGNVDPQGKEDIAPPDLRMRATAVYDYRDTLYTDTNYINRTPTVCISSYYDPTDSLTARNPVGLPDVSGDLTARLLPTQPVEGIARSNNGVVYSPPYTSNSGRIRAIATYLPELKAQAKLMFPNGRIVNEPLQKALSKLNNRGDILDLDKPLSLSENSAIDTAICSLEIVDGTLKFQSNPVIPHGAIREATFLDGREIKSIYQSESQSDGSSSDNTLLGVSTNQYLKVTDYNLQLEQRQPLEIRLTEINLDTNETKGITRKELNLNNVRNEYVLPNSGIIYATRDDALLDDSFNNTLSEESDRPTETKLLSPTDFKLDPTRRPNGIRLVNGSNLSRTRENTYRPVEKGLILASNLPVYIKGDFNLHQTPSGEKLEEFLEELQLPRWDNFYSRNPELNPNFACRPGKLGCSDWEEESDTWRPATIISDAVTLLSNTFNDGFRNQGDYDLNNNAGSGGGYDFNGNGSLNDRIDEKDVGIDLNYDGDIDDVVVETDLSPIKRDRKNNGFWDNSFVTSAFWWNGDNADISFPNQKTNDSYVSSYLTNGVTPIQRRTNFPEYVMEICRKIPVTECKPNDWVTGYDFDGDGILKNLVQRNELGVQASNLLGGNIPGGAKVERLGAGTTARPALMEADRRYPRRVAFADKRPSQNNPSGSSQTNPSGSSQNNPSGSSQNNPSGSSQNNPSGSSQNNPSGSSQTNPSGSSQTNPQNTAPSNTAPSNTPAGSTQSNTRNLNFIISQLNSPGFPSGSSSGGNAPSSPQPGTTQPGSSTQPGVNQSGNSTQPGVNQPGANQPGANQPGANQPSTPATNIQQANAIGINDRGVVEKFLYGGRRLPRIQPNALWFKTTDNPDPTRGDTYNSENPLFIQEYLPGDGQPLLVPVLQIHSPNGSPSNNLDPGNSRGYATNWLQTPQKDMTVNATFVSGNSPSRPQEESAGLPNFVRFLENWQDKTVNIAGSFIQMKRSAYATAPFATILNETANTTATLDKNLSLFNYRVNAYMTNNGIPGGSNNTTLGGTVPYFASPNRQWMFDVALLSQEPDLFAQKFTIPSTSSPNEFFREVNRDDAWVQTLLCAAVASDRVGQSTAAYTQYAVTDKKQRPASCQNDDPIVAIDNTNNTTGGN